MINTSDQPPVAAKSMTDVGIVAKLLEAFVAPDNFAIPARPAIHNGRKRVVVTRRDSGLSLTFSIGVCSPNRQGRHGP